MTNKPRVLHILPNLGPGGAERMATNLMLATKGRGLFDAAGISLYDPVGSDLEDELRLSAVPVWFLGKRSGPDPTMMWKIGKVLSEFRPQIVHTHLSVLRYSLLPSKLSRVNGMIHTVHTIAQKEVDLLGRQVHALAFRLGVIPTAIAHEVASSISTVYRLKKFPIVPNGIPVHLYGRPQVSREAWREREGFGPDEILFVCVANLSRAKNHRFLVKAFSDSLAGIPSVRLVLVGDGSERAALEGQVEDLGLSGRVRFLGLRRDIPDVLGACDVFTLASDWEGNPLSVMEAMAAGKPVVATAVGGIPELVMHGKSGLLVPQGNSESMGLALAQLATNRDLRLMMGDRGRQVATERFDVSVMAESYERIYTQLL